MAQPTVRDVDKDQPLPREKDVDRERLRERIQERELAKQDAQERQRVLNREAEEKRMAEPLPPDQDTNIYPANTAPKFDARHDPNQAANNPFPYIAEGAPMPEPVEPRVVAQRPGEPPPKPAPPLPASKAGPGGSQVQDKPGVNQGPEQGSDPKDLKSNPVPKVGETR